MPQQFDDLAYAWNRLKKRFGMRSLIGFVLALLVLAGALNAAISELTGRNVAVDLFHWLTSHFILLTSPITTPIWLIIALPLLVLLLTLIVMMRARTRAVEDARQKSLLGKTLERLELITYSIVKTMEAVADREHEIGKVLLDPFLSDQEKARRIADLHQPIENVLCRLLGSVIVHAQELIGKTNDNSSSEAVNAAGVYRGGVLVPVSPDTPYLVRCADSGWRDEEKDLQFYIRTHPRNSLDQCSVAGAAYREKTVQECHWNDETRWFSHPEYSYPGAYSPESEPCRSFIAYPLQPDLLFLTKETDKSVLGVLCLDSTNPDTFKDSPFLNQTSPQGLPVIHIMRVMYYLLQLRQQARAGSS